MVSVQDQSFLNADSECRCLMFCFLVPHTRRILCLREESFTGAHEKYSSAGPAIRSCDFSSKPPPHQRHCQETESRRVFGSRSFSQSGRGQYSGTCGECGRMWYQILQLQPPYFSNTNTQALQVISTNTYSLSR